MPHIDPIGTIIVPLMFLLGQGLRPIVMIGWAKPVPISPFMFKNGQRSELEVSLAGPLSNLVLAFAFALILRLIPASQGSSEAVIPFRYMLIYGMHINCLLAVFNLIPVPPLDGSHVLAALLPYEMSVRYRQIGGYGLWVLIVLLMLPPLRMILLNIPVGVLRSFFELIAGTYYIM